AAAAEQLARRLRAFHLGVGGVDGFESARRERRGSSLDDLPHVVGHDHAGGLARAPDHVGDAALGGERSAPAAVEELAQLVDPEAVLSPPLLALRGALAADQDGMDAVEALPAALRPHAVSLAAERLAVEAEHHRLAALAHHLHVT